MHATDIVERLRAEVVELRGLDLNDDADLIEEAADEIEKLREQKNLIEVDLDAAEVSHL